MQVQSYLFFEGKCEEAIEFYKKAIGAKLLMMMRMKEAPDPEMAKNLPKEHGEKIMHASIRVGESTIMMSDGRVQGNAQFKGFALSLDVPNIPEAQRLFAALSEGGEMVMPLTETFWAERFGMAKDRFGVMWMVNFEGGKKC